MAGQLLISTEELGDLLASARPVHLVDASMCPGEDCKAKYLEGHIPGAVFFDQEFIRNKSSAHTLGLLSAGAFAEHMKALNLPNDGSLIVVYDQYSLISAARVWFLLRYYSYQQVKYLDGGWPKWTQERRPVESGLPAVPSEIDPAQYQLTAKSEMLVHVEEVKAVVAEIQSGARTRQIWDPRNPAKVTSTIIPGSTCFFYREVLNHDGTFKSPSEIQAVLTHAGLDFTRPIITSCNRGVVSSAGYLILQLCGKMDVRNYHGSWIDWKVKVVDAEQPVAT